MNASENKKKPASPASKLILRITVSAMFLALALAVKLIGGFYIPIFGGNGMRVGFAGVFSFFPAILFGPIYGAAVSGLLDFLGYLLKPDGAYLPLLTLTAALGGALKGLIWKFIHSDSSVRSKIRAVVAVCFALICGFGVFCHVSLAGDGVISGYVTTLDELPSRGKTEAMELSPTSDFIVSLAQYNNETITLKAARGSGKIVLPSSASIDGRSYKLTRLGAGAFEDASEFSSLYIPASYTKFDDGAFDGIPSGLPIICETGAAAHKTLTELGYSVSEDDFDQASVDVTSDTMSADGFDLKTSDTWRKYLAGYINFITVGLELIGAAGLLLTVIDLIAALSSKKKKDGGKSSVLSDSLKVFITIIIPGLIVTTVNTEILRRFLAAWNGRSFVILWIPRMIEEMLVCMVQAYIIAVLYGVFSKRIGGRLFRENR